MDCKYTEIDNIILDILGRDNPIITSLGVPETWEQERESEQPAESLTVSSNEEDSTQIKNVDVNENRESQASTKKTKKNYHTDDEALEKLKKRKLEYQVEILEKESYRKTLEILKLERELQLPPSKFTKEYPTATILLNVEELPSLI